MYAFIHTSIAVQYACKRSGLLLIARFEADAYFEARFKANACFEARFEANTCPFSSVLRDKKGTHAIPAKCHVVQKEDRYNIFQESFLCQKACQHDIQNDPPQENSVRITVGIRHRTKLNRKWYILIPECPLPSDPWCCEDFIDLRTDL